MKKQSKNRLAFIASLKLQMSIQESKVHEIWSKYETGLHKSRKAWGERHTLQRYKSCYKFLRNRLLDLPAQPLSFCKSDRFGWPKPLWSLRPLIKGNRTDKRIALTIARSFEVITLEIDYDFTSIVSEHPNWDAVLDIDKIFGQFLKKFTKQYPWYLGSIQTTEPWTNMFTNLSSGPNGPAVACSHLDAKAVKNDPTLYANLYRLNFALGQTWIMKWLDAQADSFETELPLVTGKLGFSAEPAGKTRVFAVGDYWSQTSLKCIQTSLYTTLRGISTDSTKDQEKGWKSLINESLGKQTYCFDLSSASDRIPAFMQRHRLELMGGPQLADAWLEVMTNRDFYVKCKGTSVRWKVGQPLGLLSSFPAFALWHHDIVQLAANWENYHKGKPFRFFKQYRLVGDDIVIFNNRVQARYQWLLSKMLSIDINLDKSVIGTSESSQIEFTKRLALKGKEMSSIKHNILTKDNMQSMLDLVDILYERDFISDFDTRYYGCVDTLKSEDKDTFLYFNWIRSRCDAPFRDDTTVEISREAFNLKVRDLRYQNIVQKMAKIVPLDMETERSLLLKYNHAKSVPCSRKALGHLDAWSFEQQHPLVWSLTQVSRELQFLMFSVLDDYDPDVTPVEYLPTVDSRSYFYKPKTARNTYLSQIYLTARKELSNELKGP